LQRERHGNGGKPWLLLSLDEFAAYSADPIRVALRKGTERPFCGNLLDNKRRGVFACVCCGLPLFESAGKSDSGNTRGRLIRAGLREKRSEKG
jgi:hypothetical protein